MRGPRERPTSVCCAVRAVEPAAVAQGSRPGLEPALGRVRKRQRSIVMRAGRSRARAIPIQRRQQGRRRRRRRVCTHVRRQPATSPPQLLRHALKAPGRRNARLPCLQACRLKFSLPCIATRGEAPAAAIAAPPPPLGQCYSWPCWRAWVRRETAPHCQHAEACLLPRRQRLRSAAHPLCLLASLARLS